MVNYSVRANGMEYRENAKQRHSGRTNEKWLQKKNENELKNVAIRKRGGKNDG